MEQVWMEQNLREFVNRETKDHERRFFTYASKEESSNVKIVDYDLLGQTYP
jgi:hypothetical protein